MPITDALRAQLSNVKKGDQQKRTFAEFIADAQIKKAMKGNTMAAKEVAALAILPAARDGAHSLEYGGQGICERREPKGQESLACIEALLGPLKMEHQ